MHKIPTSVALIPILAPLALIFVLSFVFSFAFSRIGGWNRLALLYPAQRPMPQPRKWMGYGIFRGWIGYNGCMMVSTDMQGLYLSVMPFILPIFHKPIFIPWAEICEIKEGRRLLVHGYEIHTLGAPEVDFLIRPRTFNFIKVRAKAAGVAGTY
jgi:hypothetical protein